MLLRTNKSGLVGWWPFDNNTPEDFSGNPNVNGSLVGAVKPNTTDGIAYSDSPSRRRGYLLNGSTQYITCTNDTSLEWNSRSGWTIMARLFFNGLSNAYTGVIGSSKDNSIFCNMYVKSNGKTAAYAFNVLGLNANYDGTGAATLSTGKWYHLTLTAIYTSTATMTINGFVDGVLDGTGTTAGFGSVGPTGSTVAFGNDPFFAGRFTNGIIDDARVYNRVLAREEIFAIVQEPYQYRYDVIRMPALFPSLDHYWQLYVSKNSGAYQPIGGTTGVLPADASSDADETKILVPRLS